MKPNTRDTITIAHPHSPLITAMTRDNSKDPSSSESDTEIKNKKHSTRGLAQTVGMLLFSASHRSEIVGVEDRWARFEG
jgi:hypothetical protein